MKEIEIEREKERETETDRDGEREREKEGERVCVCVCVARGKRYRSGRRQIILYIFEEKKTDKSEDKKSCTQYV